MWRTFPQSWGLFEAVATSGDFAVDHHEHLQVVIKIAVDAELDRGVSLKVATQAVANLAPAHFQETQ